jgi:hypothetical protein
MARIQTSGSISTPVAAAALTGANSMEVDPNGTTLVAAGGGVLNFYAIDQDTGGLTLRATDGQIAAPTVEAFDPLGRYVAATTQTQGHMICGLNGAGGYTSCVKHGTNFQLQDVVVTGADVLYGATSASPSVLRAFQVDPLTYGTTALGSTFSTGGTVNTPAGMLADSGTTVFATFVAGSPNGPYVSARLNSDGSIASIANSSIVNGFIGGAINPAQTMVFLNQSSNSLIMGIPRNADGTLSNTPAVFLNVGGGPAKFKMDPAGDYLYVLNNPDINILSVGPNSLSLSTTVAAPSTGFGIGIASYYHYP